MKTVEIKGERGNTIQLRQPMNEEDVEQLTAEQADGEFDDRESFGDDPAAWESDDAK